MPTVQIPESHDPYVIQINDKVTSYPAGTEQVLTSDEAELVARETGSVDRSALQFGPVEAALAVIYQVDDYEYSLPLVQLLPIMRLYSPEDGYIVSLVVVLMRYKSATVPMEADGDADPRTLVLRYDAINAGMPPVPPVGSGPNVAYIEQSNGTSDLSVPIELTYSSGDISSAIITLPSGSTNSGVLAYYEKIRLTLPKENNGD